MLLMDLGLLELQLIYLKLFKGFSMLVLFTNLNLMEFQVRYLSTEWFWIGSFHKSIQLILVFHKGPFLVLHISYYTLGNFKIRAKSDHSYAQ